MIEEQEKVIYRLNLGKNIPISSECCIVNVKDIETVLSIIEKQERVIDLMAEQLTTSIYGGKKWIKQYFENKAKELLNK